jgi:glycosyltransferase involved in cell wall biosynthesis
LKSLVSILIPAYNAEKWIDYTIKSALEQTWPEKEIIIVDDGSIDNTLKIARHFASKHVKVISQENRGASAARNRALEHAQGDYIQWLDADDVLHRDKITEQMIVATREMTDLSLFSSSFGTFYWRTEKARFVPDALWQDLNPVEWLLIRFSENAWLFPAVWLVSRRLTEKVGPWNTALSLDDDGEYFCRVVAASDHVTFVPEAKSYYRQSGYSQLSRSNNDRANESLLLSLTLCVRHLRLLEESERTKRASLVLLERLYTYFYYFADKSSLSERVSLLAKELGGELVPTSLKWKWNVLRKLLGWKTTRKIMGGAQRSRLMTKIYWDRLLYSMAHRGDDLTEHRIQPV